MAKRRVVAMVDPDPEWVSLVDKGAARKTFRVLKRADGGSELVEEDCGDCGLVRKAGPGNIEGLAEHFSKYEHPFSACMEELAEDYPDEERRKRICGQVKALIGKAAVSAEDGPIGKPGLTKRVPSKGLEEGDFSLRKSMIEALKTRVGVLRSLFDKIEPGSEEATATGEGEEHEPGAAIVGAVFDRQVFPTKTAVADWLTEQEVRWTDIVETESSYRAACIEEIDDAIPVETQPFETGVVLLVQKDLVHKEMIESGEVMPFETAPDINDGHVHKIDSLNEYRDGWTKGAGNPVHVHRVIDSIVQDWKPVSQMAAAGGGGYNSAHPGSLRSIVAYSEATVGEATREPVLKTPAGERAKGRQRMRKTDAAPPRAAGAKQKAMGDGPGSHLNFRAGITDVETSPGIFQAFDLMQRVLFNVLNDESISEKTQHIADNLTEFNNFVLEQIGKFEPGGTQVVEEQKRFKVWKANDVPEVAPTAGASEMTTLMQELVVLLREALGKTQAAVTKADTERTNTVQKIAEMMEGIVRKFDDVDDRLEVVEKMAIGRRGVSEVTETPEAKMARKRSKADSVYDNLFPWGRPSTEAEEY
jgi:hypothetical protein